MKNRFPFNGQVRLADVLLQSIDRTGLLLKDQRRSADSLPLEVDSYLALIHVPAPLSARLRSRAR